MATGPNGLTADPEVRWGSYVLHERIGVGGMGEVFRAHRLGVAEFARRVCVKRLHPQHAREPTFVAMFLDEARTGSKLAHENIVAVEDLGEHAGQYFIAMEYVPGASLAEIEARARDAGVTIPPDAATHVLASCLRALGYAHVARDPETGQPLDVVHRDVKPHNILVRRDGAVKLADFGIARFRDRREITHGLVVRGTPGYMPPEQVTGGRLDARADLYAVGATVYELLTGRLPYPGDEVQDVVVAQTLDARPPLVELRPDVPADVAAVIERLIRLALRERYSSAEAALRELPEAPTGAATLAQMLETLVPLSTSSVPPPPVLRRRAGRVWTWGIGVVGLVAGGALGWHPELRQPPRPVVVFADTTPVPLHDPPTIVPPRIDVPSLPVTTSPTREPGYGFLTVNALPWGSVFVDGQARGAAPLRRYRVRAGVHEVRVTGGVEHVQLVTVRAGAHVPLRVVPDRGER